MKKLYDLAVKTGTYEKNGETKGRYVNIGVVMQGDDGPFAIMERGFSSDGVPNPEFRSTFIASMFKPQEQNQRPQNYQNQQNQQQQNQGFDNAYDNNLPDGF